MAVIRLSDLQFRALGFLPLVFFLAQANHYWKINQLGHMLWMCNIGNLILAAGLFLNNALLIRISVIWMVPGLAVWIVYVVFAWGVFLSSTLAHVGGLIVGLVAVKRVGFDRWAWVYALAWYLMMQALSRVVTAPELNVNVSHAVDPGWRQIFDAYWKFWLVLTLITVFLLWIIGWTFNKLWPAAPLQPQPSTSGDSLK
ncbi:MAG: hypothetical protein ACREBC_03365 [Pyrinomonadaceae bacterium]